MIELVGNPNKIEDYNIKSEEFVLEHPDCAGFARHIHNISEIFCPYSKWLENICEEERVIYKIIPDNQHDFTGVYVCEDFNDHYMIPRLTDFEEADEFEYRYGISDNASQILENLKVTDDHIVLMTPIFSDKDEPCSGWRWKKWGKYYGIQNRCCEYLNDEPEVEMIYVFSIRRLKLIAEEG